VLDPASATAKVLVPVEVNECTRHCAPDTLMSATVPPVAEIGRNPLPAMTETKFIKPSNPQAPSTRRCQS
jgi:hypothetical protein